MKLSSCFCLPAVLLLIAVPMSGCDPTVPPTDQTNDNAAGENVNENAADDSAGDSVNENAADDSTNDNAADANVNDNGEPVDDPQPSADALTDFAAGDVNPDSARFQEEVTPRDYLGQVSAWYFGHST